MWLKLFIITLMSFTNPALAAKKPTTHWKIIVEIDPITDARKTMLIGLSLKGKSNYDIVTVACESELIVFSLEIKTDNSYKHGDGLWVFRFDNEKPFKKKMFKNGANYSYLHSEQAKVLLTGLLSAKKRFVARHMESDITLVMLPIPPADKKIISTCLK